MIKQYVLPVCYAGTCQSSLNANWGSLMHGALMHKLNDVIADRLHEQGQQIWSQYLLPATSRNLLTADMKQTSISESWENFAGYWIISSNDDRLTEQLDQFFESAEYVDLKIEKHMCPLIILKNRRELAVPPITYEQLAKKHFLDPEPVRRFVIDFLTPTTYKVDGYFSMIANINSIIHSLMLKWDARSDFLTMFDDTVKMQLNQHVFISDYNLRSSSFMANGIWIKGFTGMIRTYVKGPNPLVRLVGILFELASYAGIGAKTALGMGGVRVTPHRPKKETV